MIYFFSFIIFILGLSIGSFLNVVIDRLIKNQSLLGRSRCDYCRKKIVWHDLIPVLSFFLLKGKSRCCHKKINWQYPIVELLTGISFFLIFNFQFSIFNEFLIYQFLKLFFLLGIMSSLIVIFFSDAKYHLVSDYVLWSFFGFSFFYKMIFIISTKIGISLDILKQIQNDVFFSFLSGLIVCLPIFLIYYLSKERAMGLGDVYMTFIIGFFLDWKAGFLALYIAVLLGGLTGLILIIFKKSKLKSKIAFGPFLVIGTLIMFFWGDKIINFIKKIYGF
ncbi:MAG: prepilin peptidase [Patescibacteria group bacterium]|nr:prepilin peptidase [Patescibacteria group bacterium]